MSASPAPALTTRRILALWWPLASSWLLMGIELPLFTACVARMAEPKVNLAAHGSLVFPIALVIEAPIMMLLAAATALAGDQETWGRVRRFMHKTSACLTAVHVLVAFTPLFDLLAKHVFGVPPEVVEPARLGLRILTPWTWAIAYRRTHQGVLIRFERARPVVIGTCLRLLGNVLVYAGAFVLLARGVELQGIAVGASAVACGVVSEAVFIGWCTRMLLAESTLSARPTGPALTRSAFLRFYLPLALTPLIALLTQPIGAAAMARMREPLDSLAAWPGVHGLFFLVRTGGFAYNEVVLSLLGRPGAEVVLRRFGLALGLGSSLLLLVVAATPLAGLWFGVISGLPPELASLAAGAALLGVPWPFSQAMQSWFQGALVHHRRTRFVTEAMLVFFAVVSGALYVSVTRTDGRGAQAAVLALTLASLCQTGWLALRFRAARRV
ncbi:MAG: hypothetical protein HOP15_10100 [Planctomycetes bacterium]|nr:hypothetical protein [Planctomycetota bacterium]